MKFLPIENIIYKTKLKEDEIIKELTKNIEPKKAIRFCFFNNNSTKPYEGLISGQTFRMTRIICYRNSFLPRIKGSIEKNYDGLTIKVKMKLNLSTIFFLCIWCGVVGFICLAILLQAFRYSKFEPAFIGPFVMLVFAYALTMGAFKYESNISKKDLQKIFQAEIIEE